MSSEEDRFESVEDEEQKESKEEREEREERKTNTSTNDVFEERSRRSSPSIITTVALGTYDGIIDEQPRLERQLRAYTKSIGTKGLNIKERLIIPWNVETCCGANKTGPSLEAIPKYGVVPSELATFLNLDTPTWKSWIRDWYSDVAPFSNVTNSSVALFLSFGLGIIPGIICLCCCPLYKCSKVHNRTVQWLQKINHVIQPRGGYARFQTFVGRIGSGGTGAHEEINLLVFALTPSEAQRLKEEPTRVHRYANCCCASCDSCCAFWDNHIPANNGRAY